MNLIKALFNSTPQHYHYPNEEIEAWISNITEGLYSFEVSKAEDRFADGNTMCLLSGIHSFRRGQKPCSPSCAEAVCSPCDA